MNARNLFQSYLFFILHLILEPQDLNPLKSYRESLKLALESLNLDLPITSGKISKMKKKVQKFFFYFFYFLLFSESINLETLRIDFPTLETLDMISGVSGLETLVSCTISKKNKFHNTFMPYL